MAVLLIDTYSLFFRAFHALPPMNTVAGEPTSALYGFSSLWLKLLREERPEGCAFALDRREPTFRHIAYADYKGTRSPVPSDLVLQLRRLDELLAAFGMPSYSARGFEADDVLATLASELAHERDVVIASGDRDLLQLVEARIHVLFHGQRGKQAKRYDEAAVQQRFGISAARLPLYMALLGDASDNIPKVKGIGPQTAATLATRFDDSDALLRGLPELENARLRELLRSHGEQLCASEQLVRLRRDVPLPAGLRYGGLTAAGVSATRALFAELEFKSLIPRLEALLK